MDSVAERIPFAQGNERVPDKLHLQISDNCSRSAGDFVRNAKTRRRELRAGEPVPQTYRSDGGINPKPKDWGRRRRCA